MNKCKKCGSENVNVQVVTDMKLKNQRHGILWWAFIGCWWVPIKWMVFTIPALFLKIFKRGKQKIVTKHSGMFVCQSCGYTWKA